MICSSDDFLDSLNFEESNFTYFDKASNCFMNLKSLTITFNRKWVEINMPKRRCFMLQDFTINFEFKDFDLITSCYHLISGVLLDISNRYKDLDYKDVWAIFLYGYKSPIEVINSCSKDSFKNNK